MILGIGNDLIDIRRIEATLERFGDRFIRRIFTATEIGKAERRKGAGNGYACTLAKRFAAKEAASKALGTGMSAGVAFKQIEVIQPGGRVPTLTFHGTALERYQSLGCTGSHLSLTHDAGIAIACVVLEG